MFTTLTFAQSNCKGETSTYDENGLVVPFKNLCGMDIGAVVDFLEATEERSWADCRKRCVEKEPLCFGFDFGTRFDQMCWLMNASFPESSVVTKGTIDAAMLMPDFVADLSSDCRKLGLWGCFQKNGQLEAGTISRTAASATNSSTGATLSTSSSTTLSMLPSNMASSKAPTTADTTKMASPELQSDSGSLSTGAKAGIGVGVGVLVLALVLFGGFFILKRRKQPLRDTDRSLPEKTEPAQLAGERGPYDIAELPSTTPSYAYQR
jgi:hypothetical protein